MSLQSCINECRVDSATTEQCLMNCHYKYNNYNNNEYSGSGMANISDNAGFVNMNNFGAD